MKKNVKKLVALLLAAIITTVAVPTNLFAAQDSATQTIDGVQCHAELYACAGYAQANSNAASNGVEVKVIAMWGVLRAIDNTSIIYNFSTSDCVTSSDSSTHRRIHICASCNNYTVASANSTHYFGNKSMRLTVTV